MSSHFLRPTWLRTLFKTGCGVRFVSEEFQSVKQEHLTLLWYPLEQEWSSGCCTGISKGISMCPYLLEVCPVCTTAQTAQDVSWQCLLAQLSAIYHFLSAKWEWCSTPFQEPSDGSSSAIHNKRNDKNYANQEINMVFCPFHDSYYQYRLL